MSYRVHIAVRASRKFQDGSTGGYEIQNALDCLDIVGLGSQDAVRAGFRFSREHTSSIQPAYMIYCNHRPFERFNHQGLSIGLVPKCRNHRSGTNLVWRSSIYIVNQARVCDRSGASCGETSAVDQIQMKLEKSVPRQPNDEGTSSE